MKTYIIGHTKPDTDAVVSAIAYQYLCSHLECLDCKNSIPLISDPLNSESKFIFDKFQIEPPKLLKDISIAQSDKFILVDHNEVSQRPEGINETQIIEIIDHHKINLNVANPIFLTFKPWGSTTSIIYFIMKQNEIKPDKKLASIMLSAILSDTVGFKSSTTTQNDKDYASELQKIADIPDLDAFTLEIFQAKSDVSKLSPEEIVKNDYKIFNFNKKTFIDQLETVEQDAVLSTKKSELLSAMQTIKQQESVDLLFVAVTDILKVNTKLLILGKEEGSIAEKAFGGKVENQVIDIGPKLSRKKEIAPAIENALIN